LNLLFNAGTSSPERMRITSDGEVLVGTTTDAGDYKLQVAGSIYNTTGAVLAASSGNVGVGTASPSAKLHIVNGAHYITAASATSGLFRLYSNAQSSNQIELGQGFASATDNVGYLFNTANADFAFGTNYAERMRITSSGEVLVGTTTDAGAYALQVAGSIYNTTGAVLAASSGNVGIGTTSPSRKTHIAVAPATTSSDGVMVNDGTQNAVLAITGATYSYKGVPSSSSLLISTTNLALLAETGTLSFHTAANEGMRLTSSGELLIGTTSDNGAFALQVQGDVLFSGGVKTAQPTGGTASRWRLGEAATVSPTSPNRTIRVEIEGTVYYIHAKTTND
jgi:hypothetical protein